jgi:hypothetical protein
MLTRLFLFAESPETDAESLVRPGSQPLKVREFKQMRVIGRRFDEAHKSDVTALSEEDIGWTLPRLLHRQVRSPSSPVLALSR